MPVLGHEHNNEYPCLTTPTQHRFCSKGSNQCDQAEDLKESMKMIRGGGNELIQQDWMI